MAVASSPGKGDDNMHREEDINVDTNETLGPEPEHFFVDLINFHLEPNDIRNREIINDTTPKSELEVALTSELHRLTRQNELLSQECTRLRGCFTSSTTTNAKKNIFRKQINYKRKRKDESAPRKVLSGYNLFVRERYAKIAKDNEEAMKSGAKQLVNTNISSSGKAWNMLTTEEKEKYNQMAKQDIDRYEQENAAYLAAPAKDQNPIRKRNKTGYNVFFSRKVNEVKSCQDKSDIPIKRGAIARFVGDAWKALSNEEREVFEREADKLNEEEHCVENEVRGQQGSRDDDSICNSTTHCPSICNKGEGSETQILDGNDTDLQPEPLLDEHEQRQVLPPDVTQEMSDDENHTALPSPVIEPPPPYMPEDDDDERNHPPQEYKHHYPPPPINPIVAHQPQFSDFLAFLSGVSRAQQMHHFPPGMPPPNYPPPMPYPPGPYPPPNLDFGIPPPHEMPPYEMPLPPYGSDGMPYPHPDQPLPFYQPPLSYLEEDE